MDVGVTPSSVGGKDDPKQRNVHTNQKRNLEKSGGGSSRNFKVEIAQSEVNLEEVHATT